MESGGGGRDSIQIFFYYQSLLKKYPSDPTNHNFFIDTPTLRFYPHSVIRTTQLCYIISLFPSNKGSNHHADTEGSQSNLWGSIAYYLV